MVWTRESAEKLGGKWAINIRRTKQRSIYIPNKHCYREYWPWWVPRGWPAQEGNCRRCGQGRRFEIVIFELRTKGQEGGTQVCDERGQGDKQVLSLQDRWCCHQAWWEGGGGELSTWSTGEQVWLAGGEVKTKQNKCTVWLLWMPRKPTGSLMWWFIVAVGLTSFGIAKDIGGPCLEVHFWFSLARTI